MSAEKEEIRKRFIQLAWPVVIQEILLMIMFDVDTAMVGRLKTAEALAAMGAMGIIGPVRWAIMAVIIGIPIGTVATVARSFGEKNEEKATAFAATSYFLTLIVGIITTIVVCVLSSRIPALFINDPEVIRQGAGYLWITFLFFIFTYASMTGASILRAAGDTRSPMIITVFSNILNIFGNWLLIFGKMGFPRLGLFGAGLSTGICKAVEGSLMTLLIFSPLSKVRLKPSSFRLVNRSTIRTLLKISIPASSEPFFVNSGFLVFTKIVASMGTYAVAVNRIALAVESLSYMPGHAFMTTCTTLVGHKVGEGSAKGVKHVVKHSMKVSVSVMSGVGLLFLIFPRLLANIFTNDKEVIATAAMCLMIGAAEQPFMGIVQILKGAFHGSGETKTPVILGAIGVWIPRLFFSYFLAIHLNMGLAGIWIATTIDWITRAGLYIWRFRVHQKKLNLTLKPVSITAK